MIEWFWLLMNVETSVLLKYIFKWVDFGIGDIIVGRILEIKALVIKQGEIKHALNPKHRKPSRLTMFIRLIHE